MLKFNSLLFLLACIAQPAMCQWQLLNMSKQGGGTIADVRTVAVYADELYAGTTDGVWKSSSTDGGDWVRLGTGLEGGTIEILSIGEHIIASNKAKVFILDEVSMMWDTTDYTGYIDQSIAQIKRGDTNYIFVPHWGQGIFVSKDGGVTWRQDSATGPEQTAACPTCTGLGSKNILGMYTFPGDTLVYGIDKRTSGQQVMVYSPDFGTTWHWRDAGYFFNPRSLLARNFGGQRYVYYSGDNGNYNVKKTPDMGLSWTTSTKTYANVLHLTGGDNGAIYAIQKDTRIIYSVDNGATWNPFVEGITDPKKTGNLALSSNFLYFANKTDGIWKYEMSDVPVMAAGYPDTVSVGTVTAEVKVRSAIADSVVFVLIAADSATPQLLNVLAGTDGNGSPAIRTGGRGLSDNSERQISFTGLVSETTYKLYTVLLTNSGNLSVVDSLSFTTKEMPTSYSGSVAESFKVYPNPAHTEVKVVSATGIDKLALYNIVGQEVKAATTQGMKDATLNLDGLAPGQYILHIQSSGNIQRSLLTVE